MRVNIVAHLLALVAEYLVFAAFEVALDQIAEETVEFDAGVVRTGEATAAETAGWHAEVAPVFLDHHVGGNLGGPEERMLGLVDGEILGNAIGEGGIRIVPTGFEFGQRDDIRSVAIDLVGGHVDKRCIRAGLARRFEHVQRADGVGVEVVERNGGRAVVARLGGGMDDGIGADLLDQLQNAGPVTDVDFVMDEAGQVGLQALLVPTGITLRTEEHGALVVVNAMDLPAEAGEVQADFRAYQSR